MPLGHLATTGDADARGLESKQQAYVGDRHGREAGAQPEVEAAQTVDRRFKYSEMFPRDIDKPLLRLHLARTAERLKERKGSGAP